MAFLSEESLLAADRADAEVDALLVLEAPSAGSAGPGELSVAGERCGGVGEDGFERFLDLSLVAAVGALDAVAAAVAVFGCVLHEDVSVPAAGLRYVVDLDLEASVARRVCVAAGRQARKVEAFLGRL
ncbi:MAG: hypothetical protein DRQ39_09085, partial [Gammaproteobacteria bacterium]